MKLWQVVVNGNVELKFMARLSVKHVSKGVTSTDTTPKNSSGRITCSVSSPESFRFQLNFPDFSWSGIIQIDSLL
jgi:hypothetical protein